MFISQNILYFQVCNPYLHIFIRPFMQPFFAWQFRYIANVHVSCLFTSYWYLHGTKHYMIESPEVLILLSFYFLSYPPFIYSLPGSHKKKPLANIFLFLFYSFRKRNVKSIFFIHPIEAENCKGAFLPYRLCY